MPVGKTDSLFGIVSLAWNLHISQEHSSDERKRKDYMVKGKKYRDEAQKEKHISKNLAFYTLSGIPGR